MFSRALSYLYKIGGLISAYRIAGQVIPFLILTFLIYTYIVKVIYRGNKTNTESTLEAVTPLQVMIPS